ncbi:hypothetical protein ACFLV0_05690 [Chloroflexota bacterium]
MIKRMINKLHEESGQALTLVMVLLVFGSLAIVPLLQYTNSSLPINETDKQLTNELYAAEAGAKDAIRGLVEEAEWIPEVDGEYGYNIAPVNGKAVEVEVYRKDTNVFNIISIATGEGGSTTVDAYIVSSSSWGFAFDKAIISNGDIEVGPQSYVDGDVEFVGEFKPFDEDAFDEQIDGTIIQDEDPEGDGLDWWPTLEEMEGMSEYYRALGEEGTLYDDGDIIQLSETEETTIGPLYCAGDLQIKGTGIVNIGGTVFVEGSLDVSPTPDCIIELYGHTIFVNCWADFSELASCEDLCDCPSDGSIGINPSTDVRGSGCIIAIGDITYQPALSSDDYILIWSLAGRLTLLPNDNFIGSAVAYCEVDAQPKTWLTYVEPPEGFEFPGLDGIGYGFGYDLTIRTWEIDAIPY